MPFLSFIKKDVMNTTTNTNLMRESVKVGGTALLYFLSAKAVAPLSLVESGSVFAIWPPTGVALSAFFLFGYRAWLGVFLGALALNLTLTPFLPSAQIAVTNTLGPMAGFWLLRRLGNEAVFEEVRSMAFFFLAIFAASLVTATGGGFALWLHGLVPAAAVPSVWIGWFLGDLIGFLLIAPLVAAFRCEPKPCVLLFSVEGVLMVLVLAFVGASVFGPLNLFDMVSFPVEYFLLPPLIWGALRFGSSVAVLSLLAIALFSIGGTIAGHGPFIRENPNHSLWLLQSFNGVLAVTILLMASIFREKERALEAERKSNTQALLQQSKLALIGEMVGAIAHQWRQPLNTLGLTVQDLEDAFNYGELDKKTLERDVEESLRQIAYMSQTIEDFRNFVKPARAKAPFSPSAAVERAVKLVERQLAGKEIRVDTALSREGRVLGVESELAQAVINLLNNARDAILERRERTAAEIPGEIRIVVETEETAIRMMVEDNGGGIPPQLAEKLFDPYVSTKGEKGTGIGLSMVKTIVEEGMEGTLFEENGAEGARFVLTFPRMAE